jgi:6-phosphogluconolactonase/glucosamine-6-phosphate isomerase/deaminase
MDDAERIRLIAQQIEDYRSWGPALPDDLSQTLRSIADAHQRLLLIDGAAKEVVLVDSRFPAAGEVGRAIQVLATAF